MWDIVLSLFWSYGILGLIGLVPILLLLPKDKHCFLVPLAPVVGFILTTVVACLLVSWDLPVRRWAWLWALIASLPGAFWIGKTAWNQARRRVFEPAGTDQQKFSSSRDLGYIGCLIVAGVLLTLPLLVGGSSFTVLRGNGNDSQNYIAIANFLEEEALSWGALASREELAAHHPVYPNFFSPQGFQGRWVTSATMAFCARTAGLENYRILPAYALLQFLLALGPVWCLSRFPSKWDGVSTLPKASDGIGIPSYTGFFLCLAVVCGFWGQVVLDIQALSQMNALPLQLFLVVFLVHSFSRNGRPDETQSVNFRLGGLLFLGSLALTLQYIEILPVFFLGLFLWCWRQWAFTKGVPRWSCVLPLVWVTAGFATALVLQPSLFGFVWGQRTQAASLQVSEWWRGTFPFLYYQDPYSGLAGMAPITAFFRSQPGLVWVILKVLVQVIGILCCVVLAFSVGSLFRQRHPLLLTCNCFLAASFLTAAAFLIIGQRWTAGKAVAFGFPFLLFSWVYFLLWLAQVKPKSMSTPSFRTAQCAVVFLLISQIVLAAARVGIAWSGQDYLNYVWSVEKYRKRDWDPSPFLSLKTGIPAGKTLGLALPDPWETEYWWNVFRRQGRLVNLSFSWDGERREIPELVHKPDIPEYLLVPIQMAQNVPEYVNCLIAHNDSYALLRTAGLQRNSPMILWIQEPKEKEGEWEAALAVLAWKDGKIDLDRIFLSQSQEIPIMAVGFGMAGKIKEFGPGTESSLPLRHGINYFQFRGRKLPAHNQE